MQFGKVLFCLLIGSFITVALADDQDILVQAKKLLADKEAEQAYQLLSKHRSNYIGDNDFGCLFGVAAADTNKLNESVAAFTEVLRDNPYHQRARTELGRVYYLLGDFTSARHSFRDVLEANPPKSVRTTISKFVAMMAGAATESRPRKDGVKAYLESTLGYDSNVNMATTRDKVAIPLFNGAFIRHNLRKNVF